MSGIGDYLVADLGGTNTRVALARGRTVRTETIRRYRNAEHADIGSVLRAFLAEVPADAPPRGACVAIAGPVTESGGHLTNLDWMVDRKIVADATGATLISVLNDLQAQGHAVGHLDASALVPVMEAPPAAPHATKLVIGVGTGFNVAPVFDIGDRRFVPPSEAGHVSLPVGDAESQRLAGHVARAHGFASVEEVLSGRGIEGVYAWLAEDAGQRDTATAAQILERAAAGSDPMAEAAMRRFVTILGTVAGDHALMFLPFGGIYLAGGVARRFAPWLRPMHFEEAFCAKGRFSDFMRQFPVHVIDDDYSALTGCAAHLSQLDSGAEQDLA